MKRIVRSGIIIATTLLASKVAALEVYSPAPDFTAPSTMDEMTAFQNNIARFGDLSVQILRVSSTRWKATRPFLINSVSASPSLYDDGNIRELYGSGRLTTLIDQKGVVRYVHKGLPNNKKLLQEIRNFKSY